MPWSLADARFLLRRASGLVRRGLASLRTRGWAATLARTRVHLRPPESLSPTELYLPEPAPFTPFTLPVASEPQVSIIIPVHGQCARTVTCLRAIAAHPPAIPFEVLVVDDASPDDSAEVLTQVMGLRLLRRETNGGFIAACNEGAAQARGKWLAFLNNDTVPQPGWLDALIASLTQVRDAGLAGAQLLYPDGRLQESGGVVFHDGSAWNYGRYESPDDPRYAYRRDSDYVSGAAMALPRALFEQVGGFDTRYAPAYYEDTDLAFAVRESGLRVLVQPQARVVHDEGGTAGTDTGSGMKANQVRNQVKFAAHRASALSRHPLQGGVPSPALLHRNQPQVLVIEAETPRPDLDSASMRLTNLMRMLVDAGAHVVFVPTDFAHAGEATRTLQAAGIECWYAPFATSLPRWLSEHGPRFDTVIASRLHVADAVLPLLRAHAAQARKVFDTVDLHFVRESRAADVLDDAGMRGIASRTRSRELALAEAYDLTLVVSSAEHELLTQEAPAARVEVLSNLHDVPGTTTGFTERQGLLFVGGFRHPPNADAMRWFLREVWPRIRVALPRMTLDIVGVAPPHDLVLQNGIDGVRIHGHVPELLPLLEATRIGIAPLRFGAGVKGKVTLSMAHGQPVVATTCAIEGMSLSAGDEVVIADDVAGFANAIIALHEDEVRWDALSLAGIDHARRTFSLEASRESVHRILFGDQANSSTR